MWTVINVYETYDGYASLFTAKDASGWIELFFKHVDSATELYSPTSAADVRFYALDQFDFNDSMSRYLTAPTLL